jgi:small-conductance mechanosensitive channel
MSPVDLLLDNESIAGRLATSAVVIVVAVVLALVAGSLLARRSGTSYGRYYTRKGVRYGVFAATIVALVVLWRPFAGQIGVVLGLIGAGVAFAMQEVIGALAGWFNVVSGRIYAVGDRVEMGSVHGDVIDITPLRTKLLEIGTSHDDGEASSWVRGRQYTGRVVAVSNKQTFTHAVFNYSAVFDYVWEELTIPIPFDGPWEEAEAIVLEEVQRASRSQGARDAIRKMQRRYPVPQTEVEPRVFVRATDDWVELAARFVVPIRAARTVKDEITRRVLERFDDAGIEVASETFTATVRRPPDRAPG